MRDKGTIKMYNADRGFGFILRQGTRDLFFHVRDVVNGADGAALLPGVTVEFDVAPSLKGLRAVDVEVV